MVWGFLPKIHREYTVPNDHHSYMLVANHCSMMDIMLMLYCSKNPFVFVGKKELAKLPLFGYFYKRAAILVDRKIRRVGERYINTLYSVYKAD